MSQPDQDGSSARRILSALADGDATDGEALRAFQTWREDADARSTWHAYHLIGDVMRSDDLAAAPQANCDFLVALRGRLALEPVVLAPAAVDDTALAQPAVANGRVAARSRARWQAPLAMAAGFLAVIGGYNVLRPFGHPSDNTVALAAPAASSGAAAGGVAGNVAGGGAGNGLVAASVETKADAEQLAPYLAAHRQSTMSGVFQMPGGDIRNVSLVQPAK